MLCSSCEWQKQVCLQVHSGFWYSSQLILPMIIKPGLTSKFTDDKPRKQCVQNSFWRSYIKGTVFAQWFPWLRERGFFYELWNYLGGSQWKWWSREHIQMKQCDVCKATPTRECRVTNLPWPQGVLSCYHSAAQSQIHMLQRLWPKHTAVLLTPVAIMDGRMLIVCAR